MKIALSCDMIVASRAVRFVSRKSLWSDPGAAELSVLPGWVKPLYGNDPHNRTLTAQKRINVAW
jgi:hypothetical protein